MGLFFNSSGRVAAVLLVALALAAGVAEATLLGKGLAAINGHVSREEWQIREDFRKVERRGRVQLFQQKHADDARLDNLWAMADEAQHRHETQYAELRSKVRQTVEEKIKEMYVWHTKVLRQEMRVTELEKLFDKVKSAQNRAKHYDAGLLKEKVESEAGRSRLRRSLRMLRNRIKGIEKDLNPLVDATQHLELAMRATKTSVKWFKQDFKTTKKTVNDFETAKNALEQDEKDLTTETHQLVQGQSDLDMMSATDAHEVQRMHGMAFKTNKSFTTLQEEGVAENKKGLKELTDLSQETDDIIQRQDDYQAEVQARIDALAKAIPAEWAEAAAKNSHVLFVQAMNKLKLQFVNLKSKLTSTVNTVSQKALDDPSWTLGGLEDQIVTVVTEHLAQFQKKKNAEDKANEGGDAFNWLNPSKNTESFVIKEVEDKEEKSKEDAEKQESNPEPAGSLKPQL